ncbi:MAG: MlaA family lipoprotein [Pikeienuella sp.]
MNKILWGVVGFALSACAGAQQGEGELIPDPMADTNRSIHEFNKGLDTAILSPLAVAYDTVTPNLVQHLVSNELDHLRLPGIFLNRVLQGEVEDAGIAFGRFGVNTIAGAGGLLDPATEFGLPYEHTDFGVTLAAWGAEEGVYHELPLFGPSTTRHAVGRVVNFVVDPVGLATGQLVNGSEVLTALSYARTPVDFVNQRHENADFIDQLLYESEDSYVSARTTYIQNRRRVVSGGETDTDDLPDIFD